MRTPNLTLIGGVLAVCGGVLHPTVAVLSRRDVWSQILDDGVYDTITLHPSSDRLAAAEAFWFSLGSFGVPLLLLGALVTWLSLHGHPVPAWIGWGIVAWALVIGPMGGFNGGSLIILSIGVLLAIGARQRPADPSVDDTPAATRPARCVR